MRKHLIRDSIQKLVFPWLTPHPTRTDQETGYFQESISAEDYLKMAKRNQVAHNIIFSVAEDAITGGFHVVDKEDELLVDFDAEVQGVYKKHIENPLLISYARARLYGSAGIYIGFEDARFLGGVKKYGSRVNFLYALPEHAITKRSEELDARGNKTFPLELDSYELSGGVRVDATRIIHVQPFSVEDDFEGTPELEAVYDELTVLKNADWSVGQSIFRNSTGLSFIIAGEGSSQEQMNAIRDVMINVNSRSVAVLPPKSQVATGSHGSMDPRSTYDVLMGQISAGCNIPVSILTGAQSGQGVSENDRRDYADFLSGLQVSALTGPLRRILELYQESGQLPKQEFSIRWNMRSIFMIEESRAKLYDARTEVEKEKKREVDARASLYRARAKYWRDLSEREKEKFEIEEEDRLLEEGKKDEEAEE